MGGNSLIACHSCHPSCTSCDIQAGICDACKDPGAVKVADGALCVCKAGTGGVIENSAFGIVHSQCLPCHPNCATCYMGGSITCSSCSDMNAVLNINGICECKPGYHSRSSAVLVCESCLDPERFGCLITKEQYFFVGLVSRYRLPIAYPSIIKDRICYRNLLPASGCMRDATLEVIGGLFDMGPDINDPNGGEHMYSVKGDQCSLLLISQWPFIIFWFSELFPNFVGPSPSSLYDIQVMKSVLYLWIQQYGPSEINSWTDIKAAVQGASGDWKNYIFWVMEDPGFSLDGGTTIKRYPATLVEGPKDCINDAEDSLFCDELYFIFNKWSTLCKNPLCSDTIKSYCMQSHPYSECAYRQ